MAGPSHCQPSPLTPLEKSLLMAINKNVRSFPIEVGGQMHLIPASWSHFHLLVSVFPSVGLIFAIGFYIAAMRTHNAMAQKVCLFVFSGLAVIGIPTYLSGGGAQTALALRPNMPEVISTAHYIWSMLALLALLILGVVSWLVLWKCWRKERPTHNSLHIVLGLSLLTLLFMAIAGEIGWEIAHKEFAIPFVEGGTSQIWSHIHVILNHFVTVGFVFGLFFFAVGLRLDNAVMKRGALAVFVMAAVLGASTYVTGSSAMWAVTDPVVLPGFSQIRIDAHRDWAIASLFGLAFTGGMAWFELWRYRYLGRFSKVSLYTVLGFGIVTLGILAQAGHLGGQINHPEIRVLTDLIPPDSSPYWAPKIQLLINNIIWFVPWQTVHFFGYTLVFATVLVVVLRILGVWKSMSFAAVHRILPLGAFGVMMNVFTGMLMMMADTHRYVNEAAFWPKMFFLPIGAIAVLYFSLSDKLWALKPGDDAPIGAKWVAVLVLVSWTFVIMGGRLLPYLFF
jgi:uncharacterized membrane protein